jgi:hypothetical protein
MLTELLERVCKNFFGQLAYMISVAVFFYWLSSRITVVIK